MFDIVKVTFKSDPSRIRVVVGIIEAMFFTNDVPTYVVSGITCEVSESEMEHYDLDHDRMDNLINHLASAAGCVGTPNEEETFLVLGYSYLTFLHGMSETSMRVNKETSDKIVAQLNRAIDGIQKLTIQS
jgi:hypothetical protein